jgi:hypothetical protein
VLSAAFVYFMLQLFLELFRLLLLKRKLFKVNWNGLRDSCGSSGTGETHAGIYAEEAHSTPAEIEHPLLQSTTPHYLVLTTKFAKTAIFIESLKG